MRSLINALKDDWKGFSKTEKFWFIILSPVLLMISLVYGLWLLFWSKYGVAFIVAVLLVSYYGESQSPDETWQEAQSWALLIGFIMIIVQVYKKRNEP